MSEQIKKAIEDMKLEHGKLGLARQCDQGSIWGNARMESYKIAIQALQSELDRQENKALTFKGLKELYKQAVYCSNMEEWVILLDYDFDDQGECVQVVAENGLIWLSLKDFKFYKYQLKEK